MIKKKLKVLVIGCGEIGRIHLDYLKTESRVDEIVLCDLDQNSLELARLMDHRIRISQKSVCNILNEFNPHIVHITTPAQHHFELAKKALECGAHVLVEKPITLDFHQTLKLVEKAELKNLQILESCNYLYEPVYKKFRDIVKKSGQLLELDIEWRQNLQTSSSRYSDRIINHPSHEFPLGVMQEFITHCAYAALDLSPDLKLNFKQITHKDINGKKRNVRLIANFANEASNVNILIDGRGGNPGFTIKATCINAKITTELFKGIIEVRYSPQFFGKLNILFNDFKQSVNAIKQQLNFYKNKIIGEGQYTGMFTYLTHAYDSILENKANKERHYNLIKVNKLITQIY